MSGTTPCLEASEPYNNGYVTTVTRACGAQRPQTTPVPLSSLHTVRVIHPFHPLSGQEVEVLCVYQRLPEADIYIRASNGTTMCLALSLTDYVPSEQPPDNGQLLTWEGIRSIARIFTQKRTG